MTELSRFRRVVTGLNAEGKSCAIIDGPVVPNSRATAMAWHTPAVPADNSGSEDAADAPFSFELMHGGGSIFMVAEYPPGGGAYWHATDTIDYLVVLEGEIELQLEAETARMRSGDFIVDRGVIHSWRNPGTSRAVMAIVTLPARPVGKGRTV